MFVVAVEEGLATNNPRMGKTKKQTLKCLSDMHQRALFPFTHPTVGDTNGNTRDDRAFPLPHSIGAARACARHATSAVRTAPGWLICFVRLTCWRLCCFPWGGGGKIPLIVPVYNKCVPFFDLWTKVPGFPTGSRQLDRRGRGAGVAPMCMCGWQGVV